MELIGELLVVMGLGALELWAAVPAGFALELHPVAIGVAAAVGAILGASAVMFLGEQVQSWMLRRHRATPSGERHGRIGRIWRRYGTIGLGLLAPLLTGAPLGIALGLGLGAPPRRLLLWTGMGCVLWSTILTLAMAFGIASIG